MPPELWADVAARFTKMRLGFSEYVRWLLERDLKERGVMVHSEDPGGAEWRGERLVLYDGGRTPTAEEIARLRERLKR